MKKQPLYLSPDAKAIETLTAVPLCTSATIDGFSDATDDFSMFPIY